MTSLIKMNRKGDNKGKKKKAEKTKIPQSSNKQSQVHNLFIKITYSLYSMVS